MFTNESCFTPFSFRIRFTELAESFRNSDYENAPQAASLQIKNSDERDVCEVHNSIYFIFDDFLIVIFSAGKSKNL